MFNLLQLFSGLHCSLTSLSSISVDGAFSPRQWILKRLEEVEDTPANNHVIIEAHKTANLKKNKRKTATLNIVKNKSHKSRMFTQ